MAEQMPDAWIGQEVIVYFEPAHRQAGTLKDVSERGIVVRSTREDMEIDTVTRLPSSGRGRVRIPTIN